jgi:hypothetical protein
MPEQSNETLTGGELTVDDVEKALNEAEPELEVEIPPKKEKAPPAEGEEEVEEVPLEDEEIESEPEIGYVAHSSKKEILAKYPKLFEEFPSLKNAYYKDQQISEILPTVADAKDAVDKAQTFDKFQQSVFNGTLNDVLKSVKDADEQSFAKIVDDYLPALARTDQAAYYHVIGNIVTTTIAGMVNEAKQTGNEQLQAAAVILNQFVFGRSNFSPSDRFAKTTPETNVEQQRLQHERQSFMQERFNTHVTDLAGRVDNVVKASVENVIDPRGIMTPFTKRSAVEEVRSRVDAAIASDTRFKQTLDRLWERAFSTNFNRNDLQNIKSAYLSKAKAILPQIVLRVRQDALKGAGKVGDGKAQEDKRGRMPVGKSSGQSSERGKSSKEIPHGMKTLDYLNSDD